MNRNDLKGLALTRLREAKLLLANAEYSGAYYLAGYAVECALKACIAKQTQRYDFPDKKLAEQSWKHSPGDLVKTAELEPSLQEEISADTEFEKSWAVVRSWTEQSRYVVKGEKEAEDLIRAISDSRHGVMRWLRRHW